MSKVQFLFFNIIIGLLFNSNVWSQIDPVSPVQIEYSNPNLNNNCDDGEIIITITFGESPFYYELLDTESNEAIDINYIEDYSNQIAIVTTTVTNIVPGNYTLLVTDANCKFVEFDLSFECCPDISHEITNELSCNSPGSIEFSITGSANSTPVDLGWTDTSDETTLDREFYVPGTYCYYWITEDCEIEECIEVEGDSYVSLNIDEIVNLLDCNIDDGGIILDIGPGFTTYSIYLLDNSGNIINQGEASSGYIFAELGVGSYTVELHSNDSSCIDSESFEICCCQDEECGFPDDFVPEFEISYPSTSSSEDGSIIILNANSNYGIYWIGNSGGDNTTYYGHELFNIGSGYYSYYIESGCGNKFTGDIDLIHCGELTLEDLDYQIINDCGGNGIGAIEIFNEDIIVTWHDGSIGNNLTNLLANNEQNPFYSATIENLNGCPPIELKFEVLDESSNIDVEILSTTSACPDQHNGTVTLINNGPHVVTINKWIAEVGQLSPGESITLENYSAHIWELWVFDGCGGFESLIFEIEEIEDTFEILVAEIEEVNSGAHCTTAVNFSIPAGSHVLTECGSDITEFYTQNVTTNTKSLEINGCDLSYIITTAAGCIYEDVIEAPTFSLIEEIEVEYHCFGGVDFLKIYFENSAGCSFDGLLDEDGNRFKLINVESGSTSLAHEAGGNYLQWHCCVQPGEWDLEFELCCGVTINKRITIPEMEFEDGDLTFIGLEQKSGGSKFDLECVYTACLDIEAIRTDPIFKEMSWDNSDVPGDNCCGSMLYYCPDVTEPIPVPIDPIEVTRWEAGNIKENEDFDISCASCPNFADGYISCPNCPDWADQDYADDNKIKACDKVRICPSRMCCDIHTPNQSGNWINNGSDPELDDNGCWTKKCGPFWDRETINLCDFCNHFDPEMIPGDIGCHGQNAVVTPVLTSGDDDCIESVIVCGESCVIKTMNFGWFHEFIDELEDSYSFLPNTALYEWYQSPEGREWHDNDNRWCIEFDYCYCFNAPEDYDKLHFIGWNVDSHPDDYFFDYECGDFDPDNPIWAPVEQDGVIIYDCGITFGCSKDTEEDCNSNILLCFEDVFDPFATGITGNIKENDPQKLNCKTNKFVRFLPSHLYGVENHTAAVLNTEGFLVNYSYHIDELILDPNFNIEYQHYYDGELFYVYRPVSNPTTTKEYIFKLEHNEYSWQTIVFNASESLIIDSYTTPSPGLMQLSGYFVGALTYDGNPLANANTKSYYTFTVNVLTGDVVEFTSYGQASVTPYKGGVYYVKSSKTENLAADLLNPTARDGDAVLIMNDKSQYIIPTESNRSVDIVDIRTTSNSVNVLFKNTVESNISQYSMYIISDDGRTTTYDIALGDVDITSFDIEGDQYYYTANLYGPTIIDGKSHQPTNSQESMLIVTQLDGNIAYVRPFSGDSWINIKQIEHTGYNILIGGEILIQSGYFDFGDVIITNPEACDTSVFIVHINDKSPAEDDIIELIKDNTVNNTTEVNKEIKIYPNPATDEITIEFSKLNEYKGSRIEIISVANKSLKQLMTTNVTEKVDISNLANGIYFIKVTFPDGTVENKKIIKL